MPACSAYYPCSRFLIRIRNFGSRDFWIMEHMVSQKRVRFGGEAPVGTNGYSERKTAEQGNYQEQARFPSLFPGHMVQVYDPEEMEFAVAVAAAASAIDAAEAARNKRRISREEVEKSRIGGRREDMKSGAPRSGAVPRRYPSQDVVVGGETWTARKESAETERPRNNEYVDNKPKGGSSRNNNAVEAWERAQMEKIRKRHEKIKSSILAWEKSKKTLARKKEECMQADLRERKARNQRHYQEKIARIEQISGGARLQAEQKRRQEELKVQEKAKKMRASGKVPSKYCFCF